MPTLLLAALCLAGCAAQRSAPQEPLTAVAPPVTVQPPARGSEDDAVRLAVFRYLVRHNASAGQIHVPFVCLEVYQGDQARDPSPFIMAAMSKIGIRAVAGSACESSASGVFLKGDVAKRRGLVFRIEDVAIDGDKATVSGGYFEAGLSASGKRVYRRAPERRHLAGHQGHDVLDQLSRAIIAGGVTP
jgi:hypothetical protein